MRFLIPVLLFCGYSAFAGPPLINLVPNGSFEQPVINGRTVKDQGGNPAEDGMNDHGWVSLDFKTTGSTAKLTGGLTNEAARTGRQSLFINFDHVDLPGQSAVLVSNFIPVVSGTQYAVGIWGKTDAKNLINADGRDAYLKLEVDFFGKDANVSVGDPVYFIQPIPGGKGREPVFKPNSWQRFYRVMTAPDGAYFAQIIWSWASGQADEEINGIMYFDDIGMIGPAGPMASPAPMETPAPDVTGTASPSP